MIIGMSTATFTLLHVVISLIGILSGVVVAYDMLRSKESPAWTASFLATTVLTSVTGFMFPFTALKPPHVFGIISLVVLAVAIVALYAYRLAGSWRWLYVANALFALYLNAFVAVVQLFQKVEPFRQLAPTQTEPAFFIAQGLLLAGFVAFTLAGVKRFHPPIVMRATLPAGH